MATRELRIADRASMQHAALGGSSARGVDRAIGTAQRRRVCSVTRSASTAGS